METVYIGLNSQFVLQGSLRHYKSLMIRTLGESSVELILHEIWMTLITQGQKFLCSGPCHIFHLVLVHLVIHLYHLAYLLING